MPFELISIELGRVIGTYEQYAEYEQRGWSPYLRLSGAALMGLTRLGNQCGTEEMSESLSETLLDPAYERIQGSILRIVAELKFTTTPTAVFTRALACCRDTGVFMGIPDEYVLHNLHNSLNFRRHAFEVHHPSYGPPFRWGLRWSLDEHPLVRLATRLADNVLPDAVVDLLKDSSTMLGAVGLREWK